MFDLYSKNKKEISDNLLKLRKIVSSQHLQDACELLQDKLAEEIFSLVVVGQFKRGKTTFINALLAKDLLPTAIVPLTSIITILRYGPKLKIITFFQNKTQQEISLDDLPRYVTEKYNPQNEKKVQRVEIDYPSDYLKNGVQIIDTPGIASVYEHNTKTTYDYLPRADVAIFLVGVDPPLTQAELHFLHDLKSLVAKTFFVQNKIDMVNIPEREESLAFSKKIISEKSGYSDIKIYPLSAKLALEGKSTKNRQKLEASGLVEFEQALEQFLITEKGEILFKSTLHKLQGFLNEETLLAELAEKSFDLPLHELENKINILKKFIQDSEQEKTDSARLLSGEIKDLEQEILGEDIERLKKEQTQLLTQQINQLAIEHHSDNNIQFIKLLNTFIDSQIRQTFNDWRFREEKILKEHLQKILTRFGGRMNQIVDQITNFSAELLGVTKQKFYQSELLPPEIEFRFQTSDESDMLGMIISLARKALPKILAHRLILKEARQKVEMMVDRHCGKSRYDFSRRMKQLVNDYRQRVSRAVETTQKDVLQSLETAFSNKQETVTEMTSQKVLLSQKIQTLQEIKDNLQKIKLN